LKRINLKRLIPVSALFIVVILGLFHFVYVPWQLTWGATDEEVSRCMVGDDIVDNPSFDATRAVMISAAPEQIWPWLMQIGFKKAGFYSYDFLDNDGIPSSEEIIPEYQVLQPGDSIPMSENSFARVEVLEPNRHMLLIFLSDAGATWAWGLYPTDSHHTRLVTRLRIKTNGFISNLFLDAFEIIMMRKCLLGIKLRAESLEDRSVVEIELCQPRFSKY